MVNKKEHIVERILDFFLILSGVAFIGSTVIYSLILLGTYVPDNRIWLITQEPSKKYAAEFSRTSYACFRGYMIVLMTILYFAAVALILSPLGICLKQHFNECRGEYEEECRVRRQYEENVNKQNLRSALYV
jgi:hypothetical protein